MKYCPMKFMSIVQNVKISNYIPEDVVFKIGIQCQENECAWYCSYSNGEGECAIRSLPGLFDGLQDIAKEIGIK